MQRLEWISHLIIEDLDFHQIGTQACFFNSDTILARNSDRLHLWACIYEIYAAIRVDPLEDPQKFRDLSHFHYLCCF